MRSFQCSQPVADKISVVLISRPPPPGGNLLQPPSGVRYEGERWVLDDLVGSEGDPILRVVQGEELPQQRLRIVTVLNGRLVSMSSGWTSLHFLPRAAHWFSGRDAQDGGSVRRSQTVPAGLQPLRPVLAYDDQRLHHIITILLALISSASFSSKYATMDALACIFHIPPSASEQPHVAVLVQTQDELALRLLHLQEGAVGPHGDAGLTWTRA